MNNKILNIAHKGASESYPENTLLAFEKAIEMGSDMLELDLRLSRDKQVVVFHDERISLKNFGKKSIDELTLEELKKVELTKSQRIPLFKEVIEKFRNRCSFYIDLKDENALEPALAVLKEEDCIRQAVLGVSSPKLIEKARSLNGKLAVSLLVGLDAMDKIFDLGREYKPDYLHPCWEKYSKTPSSLLTEEFFDNVKEGNFRIVTWHEESEDELERLSALPVDGICTDNPGLLSKILKRM